MAVSPRRTFARSFVITLVAGSAVAACAPKGHRNPPPPPEKEAPPPIVTDTANPPPPTEPAAPADPGTPPTVGVVTNPPRPTEPPAPPAPGGPQQAEPQSPGASNGPRKWSVSRSGGTCTATPELQCATPPPGRSSTPCNPPPVYAYACPPNLADNARITVLRIGSGDNCIVEQPKLSCPKGAHCNPPPPQRVPCPKPKP